MKKFKRIVKTRLWHIVSTACLLLCLNTIVATGTTSTQYRKNSNPNFSEQEPDGFSWYFTFQSLFEGSIDADFSVSPTRVSTGYVGFQVVQVIQLWSAGNVISEQSIVLDCIIHGNEDDINYSETSNDWSLYLPNDASISCQSVDLKTAILTLSNGTLDPCFGVAVCQIPVDNVFVEAGIGTDSGKSVPVFRYEELEFLVSKNEMTLRTNKHQTSSSIGVSYLAPSHLRIAKEGQYFNHYVNTVLHKADPHFSDAITFSSSPQTIYFGNDPNTGTYGQDIIIKDGIFDPYSGGYFIK